MRARAVELQGFIVNLLDKNVAIKCGKDGLRTTIPVTGEYGTECQTQFDDNFEPIDEEYGKLNGCFPIFYPSRNISAEEKEQAKSLEAAAPHIPQCQAQRAQTYFVVSRAYAIKALAEDWSIKSQLLIPADSFTDNGEQIGRGFVLASLLKDC